MSKKEIQRTKAEYYQRLITLQIQKIKVEEQLLARLQEFHEEALMEESGAETF